MPALGLDASQESGSSTSRAATGLVRRALPSLLAMAAALALWAPLTIALRPFLPSPIEVAVAVARAFANVEFYTHLLATLRRILVAWSVSMALGTPLALLMGRNKVVEGLFLPWVMIALALPSPVVVLFVILFFGIEEASALLALCIVVLPFGINIVHERMKSLDAGLLKMADAYGLSTRQRVKEVFIPHVAPGVLSAARFTFAMSWKLVIIMEAIARPNGLGSQLQYFFRLLRPADMIAWAMTFIIVMVMVEIGVFRPIASRTFDWRDA